jgi:hypothetical protein
LRSKFYVWLGEILGTREKEEVRSGNQEQEHIDCTRQVEYCVAEKGSSRRYVVLTDYCKPSRYEDGKEDEATCNGVTDGLIIYEPRSQLEEQ